MKFAIKLLVGLALIVFLLWVVWAAGMAFECEYPYTFTLMRLQTAKSVTGVPASDIIRADGQNWGPHLHWHTCSYCADYCGDHKGLTSVHLAAPDNHTVYYFGYCSKTRTLVPMNDATAAHFPSLMPAGDYLLAVSQLSRTGGGELGYGVLKLPAKWFQSVTLAELGGAANRGQPVRSETNRTSAAAGPGR